MSIKNLGEFEFAVLGAIITVGDEAYGIPVREIIEKKSARPIAVGAIYTTLSRLEKKGYVKSRTGDKTASRGGRAKRYYSVTPKGKEAIDVTVQAMRAAIEGFALS